MRAIEMAGINMARGWNVASLNEFRTYFGLAPHDSFESITSDKDVASSLKALYGKPDNVELYPGLVVEDAKEATLPGSGLCPGLTTGQAIL
jgi:linoleate 8R-lipoxygenase/9,12-octadecadienoate 8-hydroperoxide 8R-isomerase